jgi:predicted metal-dependent hydrolase
VLTLPDGGRITVPVRARRRQRRLRLGVDIGGSLRCSVPLGTPAAEIDRFLADHTGWAAAALADWRARASSLGHLGRAGTEAELRGVARRQAEQLVARRAAELGVAARRIRIGDPRSRWGSASSRGTLSFSFRLALAPEWIFDYVVCHEVAHLREPNHSPAFWAIVDRLCARRAEAQGWLRTHGPALHAWRAV